MQNEVLSGKDVPDVDQTSIWHAFGPTRSSNFMVKEAHGVYVTDMDGRTYLDAMAGLWCVNVGYSQERIAKKAYEQMVQLPYYPLSSAHIPAALLSEKLNSWLKGSYQIFFSNSGSEANEVAFKIARQYHALKGEGSRFKIISRYRGYHGATLGALSATGQHQRKYRYEPLAPGFIHIHPPDMYRESAGRSVHEYAVHCAHELEKAIVWEGPETVAAFILEPIITGGGLLMPPDNYLKFVEDICKRYGVLMIVDEVICGFGRTGRNFGFQHENVQPDIVTMAKGLTSGYLPLSATAVKREIYDTFLQDEGPTDRLRHVNTFGGHPVSCAAALENLTIYEELDLVSRSRERGEYLLHRLEDLFVYPIVGDIRGRGLMAGIELVVNRSTKEPLAIQDVQEILTICKEWGVIIGKNGDTVAGLNNVLTIAPPLVIEYEEIDQIVSCLAKAIERIASKYMSKSVV